MLYKLSLLINNNISDPVAATFRSEGVASSDIRTISSFDWHPSSNNRMLMISDSGQVADVYLRERIAMVGATDIITAPESLNIWLVSYLNIKCPMPIECYLSIDYKVDFRFLFKFLRCFDISRHNAITHAAMQNLDKQIWKSRITIPTKLKLYNTCILPIFLYGSECWAVTKRCIQDRRPRPMVFAKVVRNQMVPSRAE